MKIKIDPEFSALIPSVPNEDSGELESQILSDGAIFEPLVVWANHHNTLLDGHRRYAIKARHPELKMPAPVKITFEDRQSAHNWIIDHQLSKRNVTEEQRRYLIGKKYREAPKKPIGGKHSATVAECSTAAKIAEKEGISERTVHNNTAFAEAVDAAAEAAGEEIKIAVLSGEVKATAKDLAALASLPAKKRKAAAKKITSGAAKSVGKAIKESIAKADLDEENEPEDEPSTVSKMEADNKLIESFCRSLTKFFEDNVPHTHWTSADGRIGSSLASVKAGCATLRSARSVLCPACEDGVNSKGDACAYCSELGYLPKYKADQVAGVKT